MTLLIAILLIHGLVLSSLWYPVVIVAWVLHLSFHRGRRAQPARRAPRTPQSGIRS